MGTNVEDVDTGIVFWESACYFGIALLESWCSIKIALLFRTIAGYCWCDLEGSLNVIGRLNYVHFDWDPVELCHASAISPGSTSRFF